MDNLDKAGLLFWLIAVPLVVLLLVKLPAPAGKVCVCPTYVCLCT